ncbi:MAG: Bd3614 family nucleic acid deaminase, partial [Parachlamydia sp.]|nr:Bd3614 family nucleic acid deaminase [Parachlamydia sp.]
KHPLQSPLIALISSMSQNGVRISHYEGFLISTMRPLSRFEKGALQILLKNNPEKMIAAASLCDTPVPIPTNQPPCRDAVYPNYYSQFHWVSPHQKDFQSLSHPFPEELNHVYMLLTLRVAHLFDSERRTRMRLPEGYPVACLLVSKAGEILFWAINTGDKDAVRHAEVNALGAYFKRNPDQRFLPEGTFLFTSLKSCHMCAGAISDSVQPSHRLEVMYGQTDPTEMHSDIQHIESKVEHPLIVEIDRIYQTVKEKTKINAALSLKQPGFASINDSIKSELDKLLELHKDTLQGKEIRSFYSFIEKI